MDLSDVSSVVSLALATEASGADAALGEIASAFGAITATLHRADDKEQLLLMVAYRGLPPKIAEITAKIPFGKGMAGLCAERRKPITVCNLQTDESGQAKPGAKETGVAGAIVVPIMRSGRLVGTLGIGKAGEHEYSEEEQQVLAECAAALAPVMAAH